jgi:hypothetical protein
MLLHIIIYNPVQTQLKINTKFYFVLFLNLLLEETIVKLVNINVEQRLFLI